MTKRRRKVLLSAVICSALIGTGSLTIFAAGIQQQSDADRLNADLRSNDQTYSDFYRRDDMAPGSMPRHIYSIGQVYAQSAPVTIGDTSTAGHSLTLDARLESANEHDNAANVLSDAPGREATFTNLQSLNLNLSGVHNGPSTQPSGGNLMTIDGGTITVDSSVQNLNAVTTRTRPLTFNDHNIRAWRSGTINVFSRNVNLLIQGGYGSASVEATANFSGGKAHINLGDDAHQLDSITINYEPGTNDAANSPGSGPTASDGAIDHFGIHATGGNSAAEEGIVNVNTKQLDIRNMTVGLRTNGATSNPGSQAIIRVNSSGNKSESIHIQANEAGILSIANGRNEVYGNRIFIETGSPGDINRDNQMTSGIDSDYGGRITIGAGSGSGQGLFLQGTGVRNTFGIIARDDPNSKIDVTSGNIDVNRYNYAVWAGNQASNGDGTVNLGTDTSPVNDVAIRNSTVGINAAPNGNINVYAQNLTINDHVQTPIAAQQTSNYKSGEVHVHTTSAATIQGTGRSSISNNGGIITVNTGSRDGATILTGSVFTTGRHIDPVTNTNVDAATDLSFHTSDSHFYGNAFDGGMYGGKTAITVTNGADWTLNPTATRPGMTFNTLIDTLHLSNNGTVNLGGNGTEPGASSKHTDMRVANLDGDGGTFVFRTNLEESASSHTVIGHSDQLTISETSAGSHNIMIYDHSRTIGRYIDDGYVLLVKDQGSARNATFRGAANLQNGGLFSRRAEITNEAPDASLGYTDAPTTGTNWYLRLVGDPLIPVTPTPNAENNMTFSRSRYGALWIEQETLRQRLGELRDHKQDDGIWARITRGEYTMNGVSGNADYTMYHIGYDKQIGNQKGHKQYIGAAYHHTDTDLNYRHFTDDSDMDADIGTIYYTNLGDKGHYLDIVGKFGRMKGKMKTFGEFPESAKWDSPFYSLSAEYGRKILYDNGWYWEPQAQLTYSHLGSDNYLTSQGTHAHVDNINSLIFRTGFTVGKKNGRNEYYGKVFWHHEFEGAEDAYFHDKNDFRLHDSYDFGSSWVTVGLGGQVGLSKDAYLYGDVEKNFGGDVKKKWAWNIGVRFGF